MRKKVMKIYALFLLVLAIGIGVQSCCSREDYKICGMTFYVNSYQSGRDSIYMYNLNTEDGIDTSYDNFGFILNGQVTCFRVVFSELRGCYSTQKSQPLN